MLTDPLFWLVAIPAVLITGISKSGFAGGVGGLTVPLLALAISPDRMNSLAASVAVPPRECPLCGMTRGYAEMARGDIRAAWEWNRGAPVLFMAGLLNGGAAAVYLVWCWRRRAGSREKENSSLA